MARTIRDILEGVKVKSPDEQRFIDKHTVSVSKLSPSTEDENWDKLNGRSINQDKMTHHGHKNEEESAKVYEETQPTEEIVEREMTSAERKEEERLKKKYDRSSMKDSMIKQYGPEKGRSIYFATIRKQAMEPVQTEEEIELDDGSVVEVDPELFKTLNAIHDSLAEENKENFYSMFEDLNSFETLIELAEQVEIEE